MALDIRGAVAKGGKAAEKMQEENRLPTGKFEQVNWFKLGDRETRLYRFLDDHNEWPTVLQHSFAPTRPPADWMTKEQKDRWPSTFNVVCRKTPEFQEFFPDGCYICDLMHTVRPNPRGKKSDKYFPQVRLWARAVEREAVVAETEAMAKQYGVEQGDIIGIRDVEVEVDETDGEGKPTGRKIKKKKIVVFNMAIKNFFGPLQGYADVYRTACDRDYSITRKGTDQTTDYDIVPLDPIEKNGERLHMGKTMETIKVTTEEQAAKYQVEVGATVETGRLLREAYFEDGPDVFDLIENRVEDDLYHRFFDDRVEIPRRESEKDDGKGTAQSQNGSSPAPSGSQGDAEAPAESRTAPADQSATAAKLAEMRNRVKGDNPAASQPQGEAPPQEEPVAAGGSRKMVDLS